MNKPQYNTIHYTELTPDEPGTPLAEEWNLYLREVARLLAEGHEGKHVLIKGEEILGIFDTHNDALDEGYKRFLRQGFFVHQIQTRERVYRCAPVYWMSVGKEEALKEIRESTNGCSATKSSSFQEGGGI